MDQLGVGADQLEVKRGSAAAQRADQQLGVSLDVAEDSRLFAVSGSQGGGVGVHKGI